MFFQIVQATYNEVNGIRVCGLTTVIQRVASDSRYCLMASELQILASKPAEVASKVIFRLVNRQNRQVKLEKMASNIVTFNFRQFQLLNSRYSRGNCQQEYRMFKHNRDISTDLLLDSVAFSLTVLSREINFTLDN
ncbi:hypothetical protein SAMN05192533_11525 [Mesobacillus persicus]|uniref:Uncharacterized protein n=1 Tax=Mesobacillus persicus TaxID=930146 RepID=A0A1H8HHS4_9BACI|nr:hypothetical protein SAMN05192533_11525 [Mesobacillus persicus]